MCGLCSDVIAGCDQIECGALPKVDENGKPRSRYMAWFSLGETPCKHVLAKHDTACAIARGRDCDCWEDDE